MNWFFLVSGVLAIALSMMILILSQRKTTPERWLSRLAIAAAMAWAFTIMALCVIIITIINGASRMRAF
jgi:hypothetical protein